MDRRHAFAMWNWLTGATQFKALATEAIGGDGTATLESGRYAAAFLLEWASGLQGSADSASECKFREEATVLLARLRDDVLDPQSAQELVRTSIDDFAKKFGLVLR